MVVKIKNKTANIIQLNANDSLIVLAPGDPLYCFYNKPLLSDQNRIRELLISDSISFLDENGNVVVKKDVTEPNGIKGLGLIGEMFQDLIFRNNSKEDKIRLKNKISSEILGLIKSMFNDDAIVNYTELQLITALKSQSVYEYLQMNFLNKVGDAINAITTEPTGFFTVNRKTKLRDICNSVVLN